MPSIQENRDVWGNENSWEADGDSWSTAWGGAETQWHATILPRICRFVPAARVLEIAPGYGRWTSFLIDCADQYIGVDMNPNCVSACRTRFASASHATFLANDGKSLAMIGDNSIDFAFSFDSLVHVEIDVIEAYLHELSRKLSPTGLHSFIIPILVKSIGQPSSCRGFFLERRADCRSPSFNGFSTGRGLSTSSTGGRFR